MIIAAWLKDATDILADNFFENPRLDAEIILAHTISRPRTWLHAHSDETLDIRKQEIASARIDLRLDHVPVAYIIGHKEFYSRRFSVTTATLIPRPESETLIELFLKYYPEIASPRVIDVGTGCGILGITAKLERPDSRVTLLDTSPPALAVARKNAQRLDADVDCLESDLLASYPFSPDVALVNLPYVDESWERSKETDHEPSDALFAGKNGLALIEECFAQLSRRMKSGAVAIFEADPRQFQDIESIASELGFILIETNGFALAFRRR